MVVSTPPAASRERPRIALRGLGSISAFGATRTDVFRAYAEPVPRLTARDFGQHRLPCGALGPTEQSALADFLAARPRTRGLDRSVHLGLYAARAAADEAWQGPIPERLGVVLGSSRGATGLLEAGLAKHIAGEPLLPSTSPTTTLGNLSSWAAQELSPAALAAPELSSTCSSACSAIGVAMAFLRAGMADAFVTGGTEAPLTPFTLAQMCALGVHSRSMDAVPCRPCASDSLEKNSMVLGEGAAVLALEAVWPNAKPGLGLAWLAGVGFAIEPTTSKTSIRRDGLGLRLSMERALADAGGPPPDVVITHTPGTEQGDRAEIEALIHIFGSDLPIVTSNKWLLGHTLGASGALSVEYAVAMLSGVRPIAYPYPTPFGASPPSSVARVLVNSIGFGGTASSVVVDRWG